MDSGSAQPTGKPRLVPYVASNDDRDETERFLEHMLEEMDGFYAGAGALADGLQARYSEQRAGARTQGVVGELMRRHPPSERDAIPRMLEYRRRYYGERLERERQEVVMFLDRHTGALRANPRSSAANPASTEGDASPQSERLMVGRTGIFSVHVSGTAPVASWTSSSRSRVSSSTCGASSSTCGASTSTPMDEATCSAQGEQAALSDALDVAVDIEVDPEVAPAFAVEVEVASEGAPQIAAPVASEPASSEVQVEQPGSDGPRYSFRPRRAIASEPHLTPRMKIYLKNLQMKKNNEEVAFGDGINKIGRLVSIAKTQAMKQFGEEERINFSAQHEKFKAAIDANLEKIQRSGKVLKKNLVVLPELPVLSDRFEAALVEADQENDKEGQICLICLEPKLTETEVILQCPFCPSSYHHPCIERWLGSSSVGFGLKEKKCPVCKKQIMIVYE